VLEDVTPIILTHNEEDNIDRTLERLYWAGDIVVVDSFSNDATIALAQKHRQVRIFQRAFDQHARQWNYALSETGIATEWVLALDADFVLTAEFIDQLSRLRPGPEVDAFSAGFTYCIFGTPIHSAVYPEVSVLFRRRSGRYVQDGHTQRLQVPGRVIHLTANILHDDRKPLSRWLAAQDRYMKLEAAHLARTKRHETNWADRARHYPPIAPILIFFYAYVIKGGWRDGRHGLYYAIQRMLAEALLALRLIELRRL
jgi:glycosyltransferase involved in cell wall biosynthesis